MKPKSVKMLPNRVFRAYMKPDRPVRRKKARNIARTPPANVEVRVSTPTASQSSMRRFVLERRVDLTGTSGTGIVAEGVEFSNGQCAVHWLSQLETVTVSANVRVVMRLHGHDGRTSLRWLEGA